MLKFHSKRQIFMHSSVSAAQLCTCSSLFCQSSQTSMRHQHVKQEAEDWPCFPPLTLHHWFPGDQRSALSHSCLGSRRLFLPLSLCLCMLPSFCFYLTPTWVMQVMERRTLCSLPLCSLSHSLLLLKIGEPPFCIKGLFFPWYSSERQPWPAAVWQTSTANSTNFAQILGPAHTRRPFHCLEQNTLFKTGVERTKSRPSAAHWSQNRTPRMGLKCWYPPRGAPRSPPPCLTCSTSCLHSLTNPPCSSAATRCSHRWSRRRCSSLSFCTGGGKCDESQREKLESAWSGDSPWLNTLRFC